MKRILILLVLIVFSGLLVYKKSELNYYKYIGNPSDVKIGTGNEKPVPFNNYVGGIDSIGSVDYANYEPPPYPGDEVILKIDKTKVDPQKLDWVKFSNINNSTYDKEFGFDFTFPQDYFLWSISLEQKGACIELREKEGYTYQFCPIYDKNQMGIIQFDFRKDVTETLFKGKKAYIKINTIKQVYPQEEMMVEINNNDGELAHIVYLKYPLQDLSSFLPRNLTEWKEKAELYRKVDLPISTKILNSFTFN